MTLGIDFGTTRIVVAAADRGNFPVAAFQCPDSAVREWFPPLVALHRGARLFGWDAWEAQGRTDAVVVRSLKRCLAEAGPHTCVALGTETVPMMELLVGLVRSLRKHLVESSSLAVGRTDRLEVLLGVPANANSNQRFLTAEAFRQSGFDVLGMLNEPSAASIEYAHRLGQDGARGSERILVYDLGGGTFDVSLVEREERSHAVAFTEGIATLGGDDFDEVLAELALEEAGRAGERPNLTAAQEFLLAEECREKKETLHPNTRRLVIDLDRVQEGWGQVTVPMAAFYERCQPLIDETLHATGDLLERLPAGEMVSLYVTGGGSELPLVGRQLRERFGRRVKRSAYTRAATAIGLAIQADAQSGYELKERFTRYFGVWREADAGRRILFDALFERGEALPAPGAAPIRRARTYHPVHNIGHFRYLECSRRRDDGQPVGDITYWDEIRFPFDPALARMDDLAEVRVEHASAAPRQMIEERFEADSSGALTVTIANRTAGYSRTYKLGRWAPKPELVVPHGIRKRTRLAAK
jgi:molecular chaperone DnaK (HSP70)